MKNPRQSRAYKAASLCAILSLLMAIINIAPTSTEAKITKRGSDFAPKEITRVGSEMMFALTTTNRLVTFNSDTPGTILTNVSITGLQAGESLIGIDFRPARGVLFGVSNQNRIYTINTATGLLTPITIGTPFTLTGTDFAMDFNPVPDRIRVISNTAQNIRLNPNSPGGLAGTDTNVAYVDGAANPPNITACAYTNNFVGATRTTLYDIDSNLDVLARQGGLNFAAGDAAVAPQTDGNPNTGQLVRVGTGLGVDTTSTVGFDISDFSGSAFAALNPTGTTSSNLYTVNLTTGTASLVGPIGSGLLVRGLTTGFNGETLVALTVTNKLLTFSSAAPGTITRSVQVTGLQAGENLRGIDFRPATGQLFGVGSTSRVYSINRFTGVATQVPVGGAAFTPALNGVDFAVDFNPVPDAIRVVSDTTQNLRLSPATGAVLGTDTNVAYATTDPNTGQTPFIVAAAYDRNVSAGGATNTPPQVTTLYEIDSRNAAGPARLVTQGGIDGTPSPNLGQLFTVNNANTLGVTTTDEVGFDISGTTNAAFASMTPVTPGTSSTLYTVNIATGATAGTATALGTIGGGEVIRDITVVNNVEIVLGLLNASNSLITFANTSPNRLLNTGGAAGVPVTGLTAGDVLQGLDMRPATGEVLALGTNGTAGRVYRLNLTGNAQTGQISAASATLIGTGFTFPAQGVAQATNFGVDFNPVPDRIRLISDTRQDVRLNPNTGGLAATDGILTYAATDVNSALIPSVAAAAYDRNFAGAGAPTQLTTLFVIDSRAGAGQAILATQGSANGAPTSPNTGTLLTVASMTVGGNPLTVTNVSGFDISGITGNVIAALQPMGATSSNLYNINLTTGAATQVTSLPIGGAAPVLVKDVTFGLSAAALAGLGQENATILAADTANNRLQRSVDDGVTWTAIGAPGVALGQFNAPRGVTTDPTGQIIFAADTANNRIQGSTNGGTSWFLVAGPGVGTNQVNAPEGVAYDSLSDILYVADTLNNRILSFTTPRTTPVGSVYAGATGGVVVGKFNQPTGLTLDSLGRLYVCDTANNRLQINTNNSATGWAVFAGATGGVTTGLVNAPRGIFADSTGRVFVADTANNRIMVNVGGAVGGWSTILFPGTVVGSVNAPRGVTLSSSGSLLIGDTGNNRIQRRAPDGTTLQRGAPGVIVGNFNQPSGLN